MARAAAAVIVVLLLALTLTLNSNYMIATENQQLRLKRPTFEELKAFLSVDQTDKHPRSEDYFCLHFARDLKQAARLAGWNFSYVQINYVVEWQNRSYGKGHSLNGAYLANSTWVWIEPQNDEVIQDFDYYMEELLFFPFPYKVLSVVIIW